MPFPSASKKRKGWKIAGAIFVLLLLLAFADYVFYPFLPVGGKSFNRGQNANWLRDSWWRGIEKESVASLAARFKKHAPQIKSLAWIYVGNERGLTGVDLSNLKVRRAMIREAIWLTKDCGFDGVQWDYEICDDGDANLLLLLKETRAALPKNKIISLATPMWLPKGLESWGWSENYFARVAKHCDEIVVMAYDSGLYFPRHYVWLMRQQAIRVPRAARKGNSKCRVLLGVPTYEDGGLSHHVHAENLRMALKAARGGSTPFTGLSGLAVFADYTTDESKWKVWRELWLEEK